jgi:hypothetical protein
MLVSDKACTRYGSTSQSTFSPEIAAHFLGFSNWRRSLLGISLVVPAASQT